MSNHPAPEPLIDAAEKYARAYDGDARDCIKTDVLNAFYAGAKFASQEAHPARPSDAADAARYRWLREFAGEHAICRVNRDGDEPNALLVSEAADAAIDAETQRSSHGSEPDEKKGIEAHPAPAGSEPLVTLFISVARGGGIRSDLQTHDNSYADVAVGLGAIRDEITRVFAERKDCPHYPSSSDEANRKIVRAAPVAQPSPQPSERSSQDWRRLTGIWRYGASVLPHPKISSDFDVWLSLLDALIDDRTALGTSHE